jgi:Arc/MetJ-type ribon-helix-helix transcriptional regulator
VNQAFETPWYDIWSYRGVIEMAASKIVITSDDNTLNHLDMLVKSKVFPSRSKAIQEAVAEKLMRIEKSRLAQECAKLDPEFEQSPAEEGFSSELAEWPEY